MDERESASLAKLDTALQAARKAWEELAGEGGPVIRCAPGEHALPDSARPGQPTKCRRCRASVRAPRPAAEPVAGPVSATDPGGPAMMPAAEHEKWKAAAAEWRAAQLRARAVLEAEVARLTDALARLEGRPPEARAAESVPERLSESRTGRAVRSRRPGPARQPAASVAPAGPAAGPAADEDHSGHRLHVPWGTSKNGRYHCETCKRWTDGPKAESPA